MKRRTAPSIWLKFAISLNYLSHYIFLFLLQGKRLVNNQTAGIIVSNQTLVLQSVTKSSTGIYKCTATNGEGSSDSNGIHLDVKCKYAHLTYHHITLRSNHSIISNFYFSWIKYCNQGSFGLSYIRVMEFLNLSVSPYKRSSVWVSVLYKARWIRRYQSLFHRLEISIRSCWYFNLF